MNGSVEVIGRSCRLPGAANVTEFWDLLTSGSCSVSEISSDRFSTYRYHHPSKGQEGKAYTFSAGVLEDVWAFDPTVFNISPREAVQMDPQQRLLLTLVWEALEEAGLPAQSVAGENIGVFVGNSGSDHSNRFFFDPANSDSFMMTGNTGALISNRISYIYDLHGPSFTVDTACSSSLVALDLAMKSLRSGEVDTAIVAGVNMLLSPFPFVGFSAASMLSPRGLCRPFDETADGYVRAEGAVVLVLQRSDCFDADKSTSFGRIIETGINSDGRTSGVALPSSDYQAELLERVYKSAGIEPDQLAFVEAHGTGTRVGDPAEAFALGRVLGQNRQAPLPIGSVKSNIGHLEPASGLASVLKALLSLEHEQLPASLHVQNPNPDIPFDELNIDLNTDSRELSRTGATRYAGINNFGFGGTNAHVLVSEAVVGCGGSEASPKQGEQSQAQQLLLLSAQSEAALKVMASDTASAMINQPDIDLASWSNAVAWHRDTLSDRLAIIAKDGQAAAEALQAYAEGEKTKAAIEGQIARRDQKPVFVYSGNGSQWAGMGRAALASNPDFAANLREVDALFQPLSGWSLEEMLHRADLDIELGSTSIAQPVLFALQVALTKSLQAQGLEIGGVVGHSVGEVAAAWASGALTLPQAVKVIYARSKHQETARGFGLMAVAKLSAEEARELIAEQGLGKVEVSAINSARSITLSGPAEELTAFVEFAKANRMVSKLLDIDYPFHSAVIDPIKDGLIADLADISPQSGDLPFYSSVSGAVLDGEALTAGYWWDNVRQPVSFYQAVRSAMEEGASLFVEIGPRPILKGYISEIARDEGASCNVIESFSQKDEPVLDPVVSTFARALTVGAAYDREKTFGPLSKLNVKLPTYPWQFKQFKIPASEETFEIFSSSVVPHPLLGLQLRPGDWIWDTEIDTALLPYLEDHKVDGKVILPGAAFVEMALVAAQQWLGNEQVELRDIDLLNALAMEEGKSAAIRTRIDTETSTFEIFSRTRLVDDEWQLHAKGRVAKSPSTHLAEQLEAHIPAPDLALTSPHMMIDGLYEISRSFGLDFGPNFQRMQYCAEGESDIIELVMKERDYPLSKKERAASGYSLHPLDLDGSFHGLNLRYEGLDTSAEKTAFIPVRFGAIRLFHKGIQVRSAKLFVHRSNRRGMAVDIVLYDAQGGVVAHVKDARFRASALVQRQGLDRLSYHATKARMPLPALSTICAVEDQAPLRQAVQTTDIALDFATLDEQQHLFNFAARRGALDALWTLADEAGQVRLSDLPALDLLDTLEEQGEEAQQEDLRARTRQRKLIVSSLLAMCEEAGWAEQEAEVWRLGDAQELPQAADLLEGLLDEEPRWAADCILLNKAIRSLPSLLATMPQAQEEVASQQALYSASMLEQMATSSPIAHAHIRSMLERVKAIIALWPEKMPLRVLEIGVGGGGLTRQLQSLLAKHSGQLTVCDSNKLAIDRLRILLAEQDNFEAIYMDESFEALDDVGLFDLVISANGLQFAANGEQMLRRVQGNMSHGAMLLLSVGQAQVCHDVLYGAASNWFSQSVDPLFPVPLMADGQSWADSLQRAGFQKIECLSLSGVKDEQTLEGASLLMATSKVDEKDFEADVASGQEQPETTGRSICLLETTNSTASSEAAFAIHLRKVLAAQGAQCVTQPVDAGRIAKTEISELKPFFAAQSEGQSADLIYLADAFADGESAQSDQEVASRRLTSLAHLLQELGNQTFRLWILAPGGARAIGNSVKPDAISPVQSGIWALGRTISNEFSNLDIRLVDFEAELTSEQAANNLAILLQEPGEEREILLSTKAMTAIHIQRGVPADVNAEPQSADKQASQLFHPRSGSLDRLRWVAIDRRLPQAGEVEIEITATGLNFRDVMWAQGLLPEEALEDGFAGPTLGFECSGVITAVGEGETRLQVGDPVMALAPAAFASHATVNATGVSKLPQDMDLTGAATMPVAFLTAYYSLKHLAQLQEDEWVLIHGAAGAVGLAAVQIAKWRGAKIIATAGNEEKRAFLTMLGADHVLDTRSLDFVDQVRTITANADPDGKEGVDVVLNSLFGEAMERSLELVRPFGRFLELGKRDFYGNTKIGLRPFRRNISYFGIDADQLLNHQPKLARRMFAELSDLFEQDQFSLLPYRLFESSEIVDAFRLMQQSGHVGKIVVKAPAPDAGSAIARDDDFEADKEGTHIIIGGMGGFGLEAAHWLAKRGATSIVLTNRKGTMTEQATAMFETMQARNIDIRVAACDVTDEASLKALLDSERAKRPIKGVMHAAMVLEDALIQNLSDEQMEKVLAPKVQGGDLLDRLTREDELDYFVLFSSVSALFGNPGQAPYVLANAYLDGLARRRRAQGLPAIAVGWGAITDVGVLARETDTADALARHTGGVDFKASHALTMLGQMLASEKAGACPAVISVAPMNWAFAGDTLPIMKTPAFQLLAREAASAGSSDQQAIDIASLIDGLEDGEARDRVAEILADEVATIFRMPTEEINLNRSLSDIGMDSLMGMELRTAAQQKLGIEIPMSAISDGTSINDIATNVVDRARAGGESELGSTEKMLVEQHLQGSISQDDIDAWRQEAGEQK